MSPKVTQGIGENSIQKFSFPVIFLWYNLVVCTTTLPNFDPVNLHHSSCKHVFSIRVQNRVDPGQMASLEAI